MHECVQVDVRLPLVRRELERAKSTPKLIQIDWTTWAFRGWRTCDYQRLKSSIKEDYLWFIESTVVTADITLTENYSER